jgi:hypothetical protein
MKTSRRISSQIRAPFEGIGAQKLKLEGEDAELLVDEAFNLSRPFPFNDHSP